MIPKTDEVRIETSTKCNYNCVMCSRFYLNRKKEVMSNVLFKTIVGKIKDSKLDITKATLSGFGEFSIDLDWKYKLSLLRDNFETIHIITNFSLLDKSDIDFLLESPITIRISLYALDVDTYIKIHRPFYVPYDYLTFNYLEGNINYLLDNKNKDQKVILNFIELPENKHQTDDWIEKWENKVDLIEVWKPHNWIYSKQYRKISETRLKTCGRPFNGPIQIQVDGTVNVCCFDYNGELLIGDLKTHSLEKIYNSEFMEYIQSSHECNEINKLQLCQNCDQRNTDKGQAIIYNSKFNREERVRLTSTNYSNLI